MKLNVGYCRINVNNEYIFINYIFNPYPAGTESN